MAIWIQSLSWSLIYSLGQGFVVYSTLLLVLKLIPAFSANAKYRLSLSALTILFVWFLTTLWMQFHILTLITNKQSIISQSQYAITFQYPLQSISTLGNHSFLMSLVTMILPWLSAFYFIGLLFMLVRLSLGMKQLVTLRKVGVSQPDPVFIELLNSLKNKLHFEGSVQLLISAKAQVPMVVGFLKPIILMPVAAIAQLSTDQLETILLHELTHVKRNDYLVNILQTIAETILFFNPFVWLVSSITRQEREHCCDDLVLIHTREPLFYATALATLASHPTLSSTLAIAASGQSNQLFNRIKRIMEMKKNPLSYSRMVAAIVIIFAITCSIAWLAPTFAPNNKSNSPLVSATDESGTGMDTVVVSEENQLVHQLENDGLISQINGFLVEKNQNRLFIDGKKLPDNIARKYISKLKQEYIRVEVYSFIERLKMHPDASFMQILLPIMLSSPCVDTHKVKKPGC